MNDNDLKLSDELNQDPNKTLFFWSIGDMLVDRTTGATSRAAWMQIDWSKVPPQCAWDLFEGKEKLVCYNSRTNHEIKLPCSVWERISLKRYGQHFGYAKNRTYTASIRNWKDQMDLDPLVWVA